MRLSFILAIFVLIGIYFHDMHCFMKPFQIVRCSFGSKASMMMSFREVIVHPNRVSESLTSYQALRPYSQPISLVSSNAFDGKSLWVLSRDDVIVDVIELEDYFLNQDRYSPQNTAKQWNENISKRMKAFHSPYQVNIPPLGDGGPYQAELNMGVRAVSRAAYLSRHLQSSISNIIQKSDSSPVTLADLAVQSLIIDELRQVFPDDSFIAEEDSSPLKNDDSLARALVSTLETFTGQIWDRNRVELALDQGINPRNRDGRTWVLDPIDGTKGFIRGEHYCTALALLVHQKPQLSVLGCPNLSLDRVLRCDPPEAIGIIEPSHEILIDNSSHSLRLPHLNTGSIYFAVSGRGAFARSLSMPVGAAVEVQVSSIDSSSEAKLCESAEASFQSREVSSTVKSLLGLKSEYVRLDGQCKSCIVGAGAAEGILRLPPRGYIERIWDVVPGHHFITEAGGKVTDLKGDDIHFQVDKFLATDVEGIVSTNGILHEKTLRAVDAARK